VSEVRVQLSAEEQQELATAEQRAQWAAELLRNPAFNEAYEALRSELLERIAATEPEQVEVRDTLYFELRALSRLASRFGYWYHNLERVKDSLGLAAAAPSAPKVN
jgi:hypothetical protein